MKPDISIKIEDSFKYIIKEAESIVRKNNKFEQELIYPVVTKASKKFGVKEETLYKVAGRTLTDLVINAWQ